ncbi:MAG: hypothetical protein NVSMB42_24520 [Herpetosiphon sp.]
MTIRGTTQNWRTRVWILLAVGLLLVPAFTAAPATAHERPEGYLALGDSVPFGYKPLAFVDPRNPKNFVGYPDVAARMLQLDLTNASCPGETSGSLISTAAPDNGCRYFRSQFPLHTAYSSTQLAFADSFLLSNPNTQLVTVNVGANDLFLLQKQCLGVPTCIIGGLPGLLNTLAINLTTIYTHIRTIDHYQNELVGVTYYALDYNDPVATRVLTEINKIIAATTLAFNGKVADAFGAFQVASAPAGGNSCVAGLLIVVDPMPLKCDVHPSQPGHAVLATAVVGALDVNNDGQHNQAVGSATTGQQ